MEASRPELILVLGDLEPAWTEGLAEIELPKHVVEFAANGLLSGDPTGALIKIRRDGSRKTVLSEGLVNPYGGAIGRHGDIYASNHSGSAGLGEVLRLRSRH